MDAGPQPQTRSLPTLLKFGKTSSLVSSLTNTTERNLILSDLVVTHTEHACMDFRPARATLFLHEALVARTFQFERELKDWRLGEIQAGRGDPGRPGYGYVFMTECIF